MKFNRDTPSHEGSVLLLTGDGYIVEGNYYFSERDYYTYDGELIEDAMGWSEVPIVDID